MNNKKTILYFLPYLTLLIFFSIYLLSLSIYIKLTKIINPNAIFSELNQVFLLNPSYVTQLLLVILCLSLLINSYFVKRHFYKNILLNTPEVKKIILFSLLLIFIYLISLTFGIVLYNIVHDVKTNYLIIMIISSLFPESINTLYNFSFIAGMVSNIAKNLFIINLIYFPSFIIFLVIILKTK